MSTPVKSDNVMLNADGKPIPQPTLPEAYFMLNVIKFINGKLDTDWTKVAEAQGLKNAETAKVRFGQIKKKLGFGPAGAATPARARAIPAKRAAVAEDDEPGSTPAPKKARRAPAKPRGKKQQQQQQQRQEQESGTAGGGASSNVAASSPIVADDELSSPLAIKSAIKGEKVIGYQNGDPVPSGLNHGNAYAPLVTAPAAGGNGYLPLPRTGTAITGLVHNDNNAEMGVETKPIIKPEPQDEDEGDNGDGDGNDDDDEDTANQRAKAALSKQITQQQIRTEPVTPQHHAQSQGQFRSEHGAPQQHRPQSYNGQPFHPQSRAVATHQPMHHLLPSGPQPGFVRQPNFPIRQMTAQEVHATAAARNQGQATAVRNQGHARAHGGGGGNGTGTGTDAGAGMAAQHQPQQQQQQQQRSNVSDDMTSASTRLPTPHDGDAHDDDDNGEALNAFNAAMFGAGGNGADDFFDWHSY